MKETTAVQGPVQGQPGAMPTPQVTGITPTLKSELTKLNGEIAAKVRDVVSRK